MCCSVLQCVAVSCRVSQSVAACCIVLQRVAACCSVLQRNYCLSTFHNVSKSRYEHAWIYTLQHSAPQYTTVHHSTPHYNTSRASPHMSMCVRIQYNTVQYRATLCNTRNTLQHTATHCNTLQHTATRVVHLPIYRCSSPPPSFWQSTILIAVDRSLIAANASLSIFFGYVNKGIQAHRNTHCNKNCSTPCNTHCNTPCNTPCNTHCNTTIQKHTS